MKKIFHSGRGGTRKGSGGKKPKLPKDEKRITLSVRLPPALVEKLRDTGRAGRIIEDALIKAGYGD